MCPTVYKVQDFGNEAASNAHDGIARVSRWAISGTKFCSKPETAFNLEQNSKLLKVIRCFIPSVR